MQLEDTVKTGILFVPPQSFLRKSWQKRFCALYKASNHGIQRLEIFDNEEAYSKLAPSKIIPLTDCIKAIPAPQKQQSNVFEVRTSTNSYQFSADSFQEMTEWLAVLQMVAFGLKRPPVVLNTDIQPPKEVKTEENMLYSSMEEPEVYTVKAIDTEAIIRNNLEGEFKLIVTPVSISLAEDGANSRAGKILFTWPYRHIRRYGCNKDNFSFEAGRKCASGEGIFIFSTRDSSRIFQSVDAHLIALKSSQTEGDVPSSPLATGNSYDMVGRDKGVFDSAVQIPVTHKCTDSAAQVAGSLSKFSLGNKTPELTRKKDKAVSSGRGEGSIPETSHPISKPPRKSKSKSDTKEGDRNAVCLSRISSIHVGSQPNIYKIPSDFNPYQEVTSEKSKNPVLVPRRGSSYGEMSSSHEPVYAVLEKNACDGALTDELKQVLSRHKGNYANLDHKLAEGDTSDDHLYFSSDSDSYDHLSLWNDQKSRSSESSDDTSRVYGKLMPSRASSEVGESHSSNMYGSLLTKKCDISVEQGANLKQHSYMNVFITKPLSCGENNASSNEPSHFLQNEAEYAQILKKKNG